MRMHASHTRRSAHARHRLPHESSHDDEAPEIFPPHLGQQNQYVARHLHHAQHTDYLLRACGENNNADLAARDDTRRLDQVTSSRPAHDPHCYLDVKCGERGGPSCRPTRDLEAGARWISNSQSAWPHHWPRTAHAYDNGSSPPPPLPNGEEKEQRAHAPLGGRQVA